MTTTDWIILVSMGFTLGIALVAFAALAKYLFDRGLADPDSSSPDVLAFYKTYMAHTREKNGRLGGIFWVHAVSAGIFIATGVIYTVVRFILPRFL